jgi:hypothetical protein
MGIVNEIKTAKVKIKSFFKDVIWYAKRFFTEEKMTHTKGLNELSANLCVFCSFAPKGILNSTWKYLEEIKENGFSIHLLSTAPLSESDLNRLKTLCYKITEKENFGQDFACYKISILEHYKAVENILIANDSVIGPLFPLKEVFDEMQAKECDFCGITDYIPIRDYNKKDSYHIASWFVLFKKSVLNSKAFLNFWQDFKPTSFRKKNVYLGEFKLHKIITESNFKCESYINSQKLMNLIEANGIKNIFSELIEETHETRLKPFAKGLLKKENETDLKEFILMQNKHKQNLMLIKYFRYPFIKKDIIQKDFIKEKYLLDFLEKNKLGISKDDILNELKKK